MSSAINHCKDCNTTVMCHIERRCQRQAHGLSKSAGSRSVKESLEAVIIPIAYELMTGTGDSHQQYVDINEMWIDIYGEQLFPTENSRASARQWLA
jgi:hypothetical protein